MKNMEMRKHRIIIAITAIITCIVVILSTMVVFSRVRVVGGAYLEDYRGYYFIAVPRWRGLSWGQSRPSRKDVYFLPGQRGRMLERIREDIINELDEFIEEHGDIFYRYEISDDFRQMRLYAASGITDGGSRRGELGWEVSARIGTVLQLYHNIREGRVFARSVDSSGYGVTVRDPDA